MTPYYPKTYVLYDLDIFFALIFLHKVRLREQKKDSLFNSSV